MVRGLVQHPDSGCCQQPSSAACTSTGGHPTVGADVALWVPFSMPRAVSCLPRDTAPGWHAPASSRTATLRHRPAHRPVRHQPLCMCHAVRGVSLVHSSVAQRCGSGMYSQKLLLRSCSWWLPCSCCVVPCNLLQWLPVGTQSPSTAALGSQGCPCWAQAQGLKLCQRP